MKARYVRQSYHKVEWAEGGILPKDRGGVGEFRGKVNSGSDY
jgi:hypothetical protein